MTSRESAAYEAALVALFVGKESCNVTFVLDTSESMKPILGSVKRLLIQTLLAKASLRNSLFNIMTFSHKVNCWSQHMLRCAPDTVYTALSWIHSICCSPGRNLLDALTLSLTDPLCHCVQLIITALPDQPESVLRALPALSAGRPVNIFFLEDTLSELDINTRRYLQCLTQATQGSCYLIVADPNKKLGKLIPLHVAEIQPSIISSVKCFCPSSSIRIPQQPSSSTPLSRCSLENPVPPLNPHMLPGLSLGSLEFSSGSRVLARREVDGFYYLGTVIQPVQGGSGVWLVEFDHPGLGVAFSHRQVVCSLDMVNHNIRHQTYSLLPGDAVLSPWEPNLRRYGPGRVMSTTEHRVGFSGIKSLQVLMWNGYTSLVPDHLVLPISSFHYDRIVRQLQICTSVSHQNQYCSWLGARSSQAFALCDDCSAAAPCCFPSTNPWNCTVKASCRSNLGETIGSGRTEVDKQGDSKDTPVVSNNSDDASSSSSSLIEDKIRSIFPSSVKLSSKQLQRPPWRYWKRTGPEPQHRQPGSAVPRRTPSPSTLNFPVPQLSNSLFQPLAGAKEKRTFHLKPQPPLRLRSFSANNATTVYS